MNKCHTPITWHNDTTPAINETNLNYEDGCIDTIDDRVVAMDTSKANQSDLLTALSGVTYNTSTGVFTFTWKNGTTATFDLNIEKIPVSFSMDENGVITMTTADGTTYTADVSAILKAYTFTNSSTIAWTVTQNGNNFTVVADIVDGSITANKLQPNYLADVTAQANTASAAATSANTDQLKAEGFANGTQGGVPVSSGSPYYENNAKYWKEQAQAIASGSFSGLSDVSVINPTNGQVPTYNSTSQMWENAAVPTTDISGKADKVTSATNGHLAGLDTNGNLTDSGVVASDVHTGTLAVGNGGTGQTTLTSGAALIGNGTSGISTRSITNNTSKSTAPTGSTNLATMNSLLYGMQNYNNRTSAVNSADTNYTTVMARGIYATTTDLTAGTTALTNGVIALVYE